jgi:hypothetical protein
VDETTTAALARLRAAADATKDTYVEVPAADLAAVTAVPAIGASPTGKALAGVAAAAAKTTAGTVSLHREKHLAPLLKAFDTIEA